MEGVLLVIDLLSMNASIGLLDIGGGLEEYELNKYTFSWELELSGGKSARELFK